MADWIRMRSSLLSNPRVTKMARVLLADREFLDWLCPGCDVPVTRDEAVTKRHIPVVTRVIVGGLLEVWSMVNDTAARDGVVRHASSRDIDETAGIPGFGKAMVAVEWLEELPDGQGAYFPNFEEHNSPQKERSSVAKTGAERSREYRERKARERDGSVTNAVTPRDAKRDVTSDVTRDHREEESRGEKKRNTPKAPKGAAVHFPEFWLTWPKSVRKHDKAKCEELWKTQGLDVLADKILADVKAKRGSPKWTAKAPDGNDYIEEPLRYLRNRRWEDGSEGAELGEQETFV